MSFYSPTHDFFRVGSADKPGHQLEDTGALSLYEDVGWDSSIMGGKDYMGVPVKEEARKVYC